MDPSSFLDLERPDGGREPTAYFILDSLLRSRIDCGFESNSTRYDEDVNVYLVHLLTSLVSSLELLSRSADADVSDRALDVFEKVQDSTDPREKSRVYRMNADHLLVSSSLFTVSPYVDRDGQRYWDSDTRERIGRGKAYYHYAATFQERLQAMSPAVARVLGVLSEDFEQYVTVLFHMRGEYFHLYERLREDELHALQERSFPTNPVEEPSEDIEALRNTFLDAYWAWYQRPTADTRVAMMDAVAVLKAADPTFRFDLPEN